MQRHSANGLAYYIFNSLKDTGEIVHAISTRRGGVSPAPFDTLNLSVTTGDAPSNVQANTTKLHDVLALDESATVTASQAQSDQIAVVSANQKGTCIQGVDALLTNARAVPLLLRYADCVPIHLYDPIHHAIGVVHAGWRGTVARIAAKSVRAMQQAFGTRMRDVIACIGPSVGPCCYKIGDDVISQVHKAFSDADGVLIKQNGSTHFNLWRANAQQLAKVGVEQIEFAGICTANCTDDFYSWRAENKNTGRFGAIIALA